MEKIIRIAQYITIALWILVVLTAVICIAAYEGGTMDSFFDSVIGNVLINLVSSAVTSVIATVIMYFAFLKKIPERTRDEIDQLLNDRLNYETTNHNTVMTTLNSNSQHATLEHKDLSKEHTEIKMSIRDTADILREDRAVREEGAKHMTGSQKEIQNHVDGIQALADVMGKQQVEITQLKRKLAQTKIQCQELKIQNRELREELEQMQTPNIRHHHSFEMER